MNYIPPPYPSPYVWNEIFNDDNNQNNKWLTPHYHFQPTYVNNSKINYQQQSSSSPISQQISSPPPISPSSGHPSPYQQQDGFNQHQQHHQVKKLDHRTMSKNGNIAFDNSWLKTFRENKLKHGDPEALELQKQAEEYEKYKKMKSKARMQLKKKNKKNHNGRNRKKWYNNYIPNDQKYVEDSTFGNVDKSMSTIDHEIALIESELNEHYTRQLNTYKDTEVWPATPLRFLS